MRRLLFSLLIAVCLVVFQTIGCAKLTSRSFVEKTSRMVMVGFQIVPLVGAVIDYRGVELKGDSFGVAIEIHSVLPDTTLDEGATIETQERLMRQFNIDSCIVLLPDQQVLQALPLLKKKRGKSNYRFGVHYYFGGLMIPPSVETIHLKVPYYSVDAAGNRTDRKSLEFVLHRREKKYWHTF